MLASGIAASIATCTVARAQSIAPKDLYIDDGHFVGIIDIYDENNHISLDETWNLGVRAILHETGMGLFKKDTAYADRKKTALEKGFLWGAFHLLSAESVDDQLGRFLSIEDGSDRRIAMALDWEPTSHGTMTYQNLKAFVQKFRDAKNFYPILYCDSRVKNNPHLVKGDALLAKCPLWYARPRFNECNLQIPKATWKNYTLWQFDDEKRKYNAPYPRNVLPGADWNSFKGTEQKLRNAWPFRQT